MDRNGKCDSFRAELGKSFHVEAHELGGSYKICTHRQGSYFADPGSTWMNLGYNLDMSIGNLPYPFTLL